MQNKTCVMCGTEFPKPKGASHKIWERRKCCSKSCRISWMKKEKIGFKPGHSGYPNSGSFVSGRTPWNAGVKGLQPWMNTSGLITDGSNNRGKQMSEEQRKKLSAARLGKPMLKTRNENHWNWRGDDVGYEGLHGWLARNYKKRSCDFCGEKEKTLDWANISNEYRRDRNDFLVLCRKCHVAFDKTKNITNGGK